MGGPNVNRIVVDPPDYTNSATTMATVNMGADEVMKTLTTALSTTGGMAGDDTVSADFATVYDGAATWLVEVGGQYVAASGNVAWTLHYSIQNHVKANQASNINGPFGVAPPYEFSTATGDYPAPPTSLGSVAELPGWLRSLLEHVNAALPDADVSTLRTAAAAWQDAGRQIGNVPVGCVMAKNLLNGMSSGELKTAQGCCDTLTQVGVLLGTTFTDMGTACNAYADQVQKQVHELFKVGLEFAAASGLIEGLGALFAEASVGMSELGAQAVEDSRLAEFAEEVSVILEDLSLGIAESNSVVRAAKAAAEHAAQLIYQYVQAGLTVTVDGKQVSWSYVWTKMPPTERGRVIEDFLGQNLPQAFKTWDRYDPNTQTATSIKSLDTNAPSYSQPSRITARVLSYIKAASVFTQSPPGRVRLTSARISRRVVELVVPSTATDAARQAIQDARAAAQQAGYTNVDLEVIYL